MQLKTGSYYECGPFRLEPAEHRLTRSGQPVSLTPKTFELLVFLIRNKGRLVTKDEIMEAVWPGSFVEEANLTVSISVLRKALGEKESDLRYIETIPRKGYRFTASVKEIETPEQPEITQPEQIASPPSEVLLPAAAGTPPVASPLPPSPYRDPVAVSPETGSTPRRRRIVAVAAVTLVCILVIIGFLTYRKRLMTTRHAAAPHSLAVLPLLNLRQDPKDDFLGFSLADAVVTRLRPISTLTVRPSSSVQRYKGQTIDLPKVASELNVDTLLTGTFIHEGDDLRITYQLIDVKTDKILGRDMIDLKYDKLLTVQDKVTQQIIKGLELNLSPSEAALVKPGEPINSLAYEYYLRGVDLVGSHDFPMAAKMLEKSAEIDPNYALTWAYLGQSYESSAAFELGGLEQYRKAQAAYERALALQPRQIEASMFLANLLIDTGKVEEAVPLLRESLISNPNQAAVHWELGYAYRFAGMLNESIAECLRAREIDPMVKSNGSALNSYLYLGEYDKFLDSLPANNDSAFIVFYRGFGEYYQKKWNLAARDFDRAYQLDPTLYTRIGKAFSDSIAHKESDGLELLHELEHHIQQRGVGDPEATYKIAQAYAALGDKPSALRMLRYSIEHGFFAYPYFMADPLLDSVRHEPEFSDLMNIAQARYQAFKKRFF